MNIFVEKGIVQKIHYIANNKSNQNTYLNFEKIKVKIKHNLGVERRVKNTLRILLTYCNLKSLN